MSRQKLILQLKKKNPLLSHSELSTVIDTIFGNISNILRKGNSLEIRGFGRWYCKILKENFNARNPSSNKLIYIPERVKIRFRPSKRLKKIINEKT